ncbi:hypothetical protein [Aeromicrobium sp. Leaf291]|uniref:hypothetical protein n=1 Tax=Aeromicrobium sp. Leaf291 TaxID=1736325 RepID=UPI0006FA0879|nr:hypothetical protein [Aeromicrobium sp. Leaf291]KQP81560.1 hypothetical protein ASF35_16140 [Aeromicrobium sp. Leaf291]
MSANDVEVPKLPVLLGLCELVELFPTVAKPTVYRWNTIRSGKRMLPEPAVRAARTSLWTEEQVVAFAEDRRLRLDERALVRIRARQVRRSA